MAETALSAPVPVTQPNGTKLYFLDGITFGRWTILARAEPNARGASRWLCRCACGKRRSVAQLHLLRGVSTSCGCSRRQVRTHGATATIGEPAKSEHTSWRAMRGRCEDLRNSRYHRYGGRGIAVCDRWRDFASFLADMGRKPSPRHTIERLDNDGHYEPGNCVWATQKEQMRNVSINRLIRAGAVTKLLCEWSEDTGLDCSTILTRIRRGWSEEEAVSVPLGVSLRPCQGEGWPNAKLNEDAVRAMRAKHAAGVSKAELGREFGVSATVASAVVRRLTWKHL